MDGKREIIRERIDGIDCAGNCFLLCFLELILLFFSLFLATHRSILRLAEYCFSGVPAMRGQIHVNWSRNQHIQTDARSAFQKALWIS